MIKLPFHVDSPLAVSVLVGGAALLVLFLWWLYTNNHMKMGDLFGSYFERKFGAADAEVARSAGGKLLLGLTGLFACIAVFFLSVGVGIFENGDKRKPDPPMQSGIMQDYFQQKGGKIDVKALVEQSKK